MGVLCCAAFVDTVFAMASLEPALGFVQLRTPKPTRLWAPELFNLRFAGLLTLSCKLQLLLYCKFLGVLCCAVFVDTVFARASLEPALGFAQLHTPKPTRLLSPEPFNLRFAGLPTLSCKLQFLLYCKFLGVLCCAVFVDTVFAMASFEPALGLVQLHTPKPTRLVPRAIQFEVCWFADLVLQATAPPLS